MKPWKATEEGKEALRELYDSEHLKAAIQQLGSSYLQTCLNALAGINPRGPNAPTELLIMSAELEGAKRMLKSIMDPIEDMGKRNKNG